MTVPGTTNLHSSQQDHPPRVVALGQTVAGDDGAAYAVLAELRELQNSAPHHEHTSARPLSAELLQVQEASPLLELLRYPGPVFILDAVVGAGESGQVLSLSLQDLQALPSSSVSSHGLDAAQAAELCQTLYPDEVTPDLTFFLITIDPPSKYGSTLSPPVAQAVHQCRLRVEQALTS